MIGVCRWYKHNIMVLPQYDDFVMEVHHIPNYIALLNDKTDCENITADEVHEFVFLLENCVVYYKNGSLQQCMRTGYCENVSEQCKYQAKLHQQITTLLYNTFFYLADFKLPINSRNLKLTASISRLKYNLNIQSIYTTANTTDFLYSIYKEKFTDLDETTFEDIKVVAFDMFNVKIRVFDKYITMEIVYLVIAVIIVVLCGSMFSGSLFLGSMIFWCVAFAMCIAMFVYNRIFDIEFFPFFNITTLIFIIGIGADDVFVYTVEWVKAKHTFKIYDEKLTTEYLIKWTKTALKHGGASMFVTSLTTAAAFYANISSHVTAAKCFGLFSGTVIFSNFILMITWFPCCVVVHEKYLSHLANFCFPHFFSRLPIIHNKNEAEPSQKKSFLHRLFDVSSKFLDVQLKRFISHLRYVFVPTFFVVGVAGVVVAFAEPGLNPPTSHVMQLLSSHTGKGLDLKYKQALQF